MEINKIYQGDCLKIMKTFPDNSVDLVITSPPYNCDMDYDVYKDNREWEDYLNWCKKWLSLIKKILKPDGRLCLNIPLEMGTKINKKRVSPFAEFYQLFNEIGIKFQGSPVWVDNQRVKNSAWGSWLSAAAPYIYNPYETIMLGYKNQWKKINKGENTINKKDFIMGCSGIWKLKTQTKEITKANFHESLPELCINLLSYKNDIVLDCFMGSGQTALASKKLGRNYIGIELSAEYIKIAEKRLRQEYFKF